MLSEHTPLSKAQTAEIFVAIREGDEQAREDFIVNNLGLVVHIARKLLYLKPGHIDMEDMISEGNIGLIIAVDKFDPEKGTTFATYAHYWINAKIREFLDTTHSGPAAALHLARAIKQLRSTVHTISQELGRSPTYPELVVHELVIKLSDKIKMTPEDLLASANYYAAPISLDLNISDSEGLQSSTLSDYVPDESEAFSDKLDKQDLIEHLIQPLEPREKFIICHYFGISDHEQLNHREIAERLNIGEQRVQQIRKKIMNDLQRRAETDKEVLIFRGLLQPC